MSAGATAVLFDLDGTLVDTAPDLVDAVNRTRAALGHAPVPEAQVRPHVALIDEVQTVGIAGRTARLSNGALTL